MKYLIFIFVFQGCAVMQGMGKVMGGMGDGLSQNAQRQRANNTNCLATRDGATGDYYLNCH